MSTDIACALCHEPAGARGVTCLGCRSVLHPECFAGSGRCPTARCEGPLLPRAARIVTRIQEQAVVAAAVAALALTVAFIVREEVAFWFAGIVALGGAAGLIGACSDWLDRGTPRELLRQLACADEGLVVDDPPRDLAIARDAVQRRPTHPVARLRLALALEALSRGDEAEPHLAWLLKSQSTRDVPGNDVSRAVVVRSLAHAARGDFAAALRELIARGVARDPGAATWTLRVRALRCLGDLEGALRDAGEGVQHAAKEDPFPLEARARVWLVLGRPEAARADLHAAMRRWPRHWLYLVHGVARALEGDRAKAVDELALAEPGVREAALWRLALGAPAATDRLQGFDAEVARALRGELPETVLLEQAGVEAGGPRSRARRLRRAHGLLAFAAHARGDAAAADAHAAALLALGPDGHLEHDWAMGRRAVTARPAPAPPGS